MTNEEKAKEIAWNLFDDGLFYYKHEAQRQAIQSAIIKMAEWKDERIKELEETLKCRSKYERIYRNEFLKAEKEALIDKACEWLRGNMYEGISGQMLSKKPYPSMRDFINELKNAMKGGEE